MSIVKGDNVRYVTRFGTQTLTRGHVYKVLDVREFTIQLEGDYGGTNWYSKTRLN